MTKKIAAATEDQQKLSSHFGRAPYYKVFTIEDDQVVAEELREKAHHGAHTEGQGHNQIGHKHGEMFAPLSDCQVLLVGGMGQPAYEKAQAAGLEILLTGGSIQDALQAYLRGELASDMRRVHNH